MSQYLKGNYKLPKEIKPVKKEKDKDLREEFEQRALAKLGGSICFVIMPRTFVWKGDEGDKPREETGQVDAEGHSLE